MTIYCVRFSLGVLHTLRIQFPGVSDSDLITELIHQIQRQLQYAAIFLELGCNVRWTPNEFENAHIDDGDAHHPLVRRHIISGDNVYVILHFFDIDIGYSETEEERQACHALANDIENGIIRHEAIVVQYVHEGEHVEQQVSIDIYPSVGVMVGLIE